MSPSLSALGIDRLSVEDRIALAQKIWDDAAREVEQSPLPESQLQELQRRLADSTDRPDAVVPWEDVKAKALARAKR